MLILAQFTHEFTHDYFDNYVFSQAVSKEECVGMYCQTFWLDLVTERMFPKGVSEVNYKFQSHTIGGLLEKVETLGYIKLHCFRPPEYLKVTRACYFYFCYFS